MSIDNATSEEWTAVAEEWLKNLNQKKNSYTTIKADDAQIGGSHYKIMAVQPWCVMEAVLTRNEFIGFLKGNIIKYSMRHGLKPGSTDDAEKALHYMQKLTEVLNESY